MIGKLVHRWFPPAKQAPDWEAKLLADVEKRLNSFEVQDFRRRRAAALKGRKA